MSTTIDLVRLTTGVGVVTFAGGHRHNPFSQERMRELTRLVDQAEQDEKIDSLVFYGGESRSFCAGGDFHETSTFVGGDEVERWIDDITNLYVSIGRLSKPIVAAVDGHAIGVGLQIMLGCDLRIMTDSARLAMPEFELGIACNFGGFMLEATVGRSVMQDMLYSCESWDSSRALKDGLAHRVVTSQEILSYATGHAERIAGYTRAGISGTRPKINRSYVEGLRHVSDEAKVSHRAAFATGDAQRRMQEVIGK